MLESVGLERGHELPRRTPILRRQLSGGVLKLSSQHFILNDKMECFVMVQGKRRSFTAAEKSGLWDRWQRGASLLAIGRAFGKPSSSIHAHISPRGGIGPLFSVGLDAVWA